MEKIYVGKIVNTFGIKGELKIVSRFEMPDRVFKEGNKLIIKDNIYKVTGVRIHKNNYLVEFDFVRNINDVKFLVGNDVYIAKEDLKLQDEEYLISELIDYKVISNNEEIGIVTDYDSNEINPLIKVNNKFYIPLKGFYEKIDKENKKIYVKDASGLML